MARVKRGVAAKRRHKKVLEQAKGYYGNKSRSFRAANEQVMRSGQYTFRDRRAPQGRVPTAVDPAHQRRVPRSTTCPTAASSPASTRPASRSTARSSPTSRSPIRRRSPAWSRRRRRRSDRRRSRVRPAPLAFTNPKVQRLRRLTRRRSSRRRGRRLRRRRAAPRRRGGRRRLEFEGQFLAPGVAPVAGAGTAWRLAPGVLERVADAESPSGVVAVVRHLAPDPAVLRSAAFALVVDRVADPGNLGTILRSAEACGVDVVAVTPGTVDVVSPKVVRSSAGALFHVPIVAASLDAVAAAGLAARRHVVASRRRPHRLRLVPAGWRSSSATRPTGSPRRSGRYVGADRPPRAGGEPQRGDGHDPSVLRSGASAAPVMAGSTANACARAAWCSIVAPVLVRRFRCPG